MESSDSARAEDWLSIGSPGMAYLLNVIQIISGLKSYYYLIQRTAHSVTSGLYTVDAEGTEYNNYTVNITERFDKYFFELPKGILIIHVEDNIVKDKKLIRVYNPELFTVDIFDLILSQEYRLVPKKQERKEILSASIKAEKVKDTLVYACYENNTEKIKRLLSTASKTQLDKKLMYTGTPLGLCAGNNNVEAFMAIARAGADINKISLAETPLRIAFTYSPEIVKFIHHEYYDQFDKEVKKAGFSICCRAHDESLFQLMFDYGCDINAEGKEFPPLHSFVDFNNIAGIEFLVSHGANINALNKYKQTPLARAKAQGKIEAIKSLLSFGAIE